MKLDRNEHAIQIVVRVWVFYVRSSSPFPAKQLGRDVRSECSKKTEMMGNNIREGGGCYLAVTVQKKKGKCYDTVQVCSFDQGICTYGRVTLCTPEKGQHFPFFFRSFTSRQHTPAPLSNLITHPLCSLTAFYSDVTSQLFSWEMGGASDVKNPDPYYSDSGRVHKVFKKGYKVLVQPKKLYKIF